MKSAWKSHSANTRQPIPIAVWTMMIIALALVMVVMQIVMINRAAQQSAALSAATRSEQRYAIFFRTTNLNCTRIVLG
jgi:hypothetical protein